MSVVSTEDNQRLCRRHPVHLPVQACDMALYTTNLSASGLQLACPNSEVGTLARKLEGDSLGAAITLEDGRTVNAQCQLVYAAEHADEHLLGLRILRFEADGERALKDYMRGLGA